MRRCQEAAARLFFVVPGDRTKGNRHKLKHSTWTWEITLLWGRPSVGIGCPETLQSLFPWRYSEAIWTQSWAMLPAWEGEVGLDDLQWSLPTSTTLWFWIRSSCRKPKHAPQELKESELLRGQCRNAVPSGHRSSQMWKHHRPPFTRYCVPD